MPWNKTSKINAYIPFKVKVANHQVTRFQKFPTSNKYTKL